MNNNKGIINLNTILTLAVVAGIIFLVIKFVPSLSGGQLAVTPGGDNYKVDPTKIQACDGIEKVTFTPNDQDAYIRSTDPHCNLTVTDPYYKQYEDDGSSLSLGVMSTYTGVLCADDTSHFGKVVTFDTGCRELTYQPEAFYGSSPTITVINTDGATVNSDSNHETETTNTEYTYTIKLRAPSNKCSAGECGAVLCAEIDQSYVSEVESNLPAYGGKMLEAHTTNQSGAEKDMDAYYCFIYDKMLCDNEADELYLTATTTASAAGEDEANVKLWWMPLNTVVNAEDYSIMECVLYDEANAHTWIGATNTTFVYTA